jgi:hypothetical protein
MARGGRNAHCTSTPQTPGRKEAWDKLLHVPEHAMLDTLDAAQIRKAVIGFSGNKLRLAPKVVAQAANAVEKRHRTGCNENRHYLNGT